MLDLNQCFRNFADAIVLQSCSDYFHCKRALAQGKKSLGKIKNCRAELEASRDFFYSDLYATICNHNLDLAPENVIKRLDELVEDYDNYPLGTSPFRTQQDEAMGDAYDNDDENCD